jgi:hypothetical protein
MGMDRQFSVIKAELKRFSSSWANPSTVFVL